MLSLRFSAVEHAFSVLGNQAKYIESFLDNLRWVCIAGRKAMVVRSGQLERQVPRIRSPSCRHAERQSVFCGPQILRKIAVMSCGLAEQMRERIN